LKHQKRLAVMNIHLGAIVKILAKMINVMRGTISIDSKVQPAIKPRLHQIIKNTASVIQQH
jgi:hypothetical protein